MPRFVPLRVLMVVRRKKLFAGEIVEQKIAIIMLNILRCNADLDLGCIEFELLVGLTSDHKSIMFIDTYNMLIEHRNRGIFIFVCLCVTFFSHSSSFTFSTRREIPTHNLLSCCC